MYAYIGDAAYNNRYDSAKIEYRRYFCGDANADWSVNVGDAVYIINHVFKGGDPPIPLESAEVNCDGAVNVGDGVYIINFIFKSGPPPCAGCP
ncbi:MAG: hypothetical protein GY841_09125 [FCB group bacterium]|nr:hypothetical protein [FCB group bacterium]